MSVCNGPDTCDGDGTCLNNLVPDGTSCGKDEDQCNHADKCMTGECVSSTKPDGTLCGNPAVDVCDLQDTCSSGACIDNIREAGFVCRDADGDCDVAEVCSGTKKSCPIDAFKPAGESCGNTSSGECDNPDTCNGSGLCLDNHKPDGTSCGYPGDHHVW
jgi:hypothetical protein